MGKYVATHRVGDFPVPYAFVGVTIHFIFSKLIIYSAKESIDG